MKILFLADVGHIHLGSETMKYIHIMRFTEYIESHSDLLGFHE
jgi:hypothetical protein